MRMIAWPLRLEARSRTTTGRVSEFLAAAICLTLIASCGGGGGGGSSNRAPVLSASSSFNTNEDSDLSATLAATDADGDSVTFAKATEPASGTVTVNASGAFVYHPNANFSGNDSFSVRITDARGGSASSTIAVTVAAVNDTPVAINDVMRKDGAALASINVGSNDSDAENDALSVTIEEPAVIGTATVNSNGTVSLTNLPPGFKGVSRFKYRVTDPSGAFSVGTAAVFVGTEPFRVAFIGDAAANGALEVFMTDFVATFQVSSATEGNLRLRGFAAAENGSTIAYRRVDSTAPANADLSFVRTQATGTQARVALPSGYSLAQDASGNDQYTVSPNGEWIALVASTGTKTEPFLLTVSDGSIRSVAPSSTSAFASRLRFSKDSAYLYFLGSDDAAGAQKNLYRVAASSSSTSGIISAAAGAGENISNYIVSSDSARVVVVATRGGANRVYLINPTVPGTETPISQAVAGQDLDPIVANADVTKVAYTTSISGNSLFTFVADVSSTPGESLVGPAAARALAFDSDGQSLLYAVPQSPTVDRVFEKIIGSGAPDDPIGDGEFAAYDDTGDTVILRQRLFSGSTPYRVLAAAYRGSFPTNQSLGSSDMASPFIDLSGASRGVALLGEGAASGSSTARFALVNARSPGKFLYLAGFSSPLSGLTSNAASVVTY